jgi:PAS domain-containing protein
MQTFYELVNKQWKVYRCIGNSLPLGHRQHFADVDIPRVERLHMKRKNGIINKNDSDHTKPNSLLEISQIRHFNEVFLRFLNVGVVMIDRTYRIVTANGAARRLLGLREVGIDQDFLHAVRGVPYHQVRIAIDTVFRECSPINLTEVELESLIAENGRYVNLSLALVQVETGLPDLAIISVTDVTQQVRVRQQLETIQAEQRKLMNELGTANKHLSDMNKELMETNEGLQVANEELVLTHEELQASIEEFETTNEELQATNEELETNNEELQATNEELETTNDELRARTNELQELTTLLENESGRLAKMVELAPFYILVLRGPNLIVEAYNPYYARSIENRPVQGQPLDKVIDLFWETGWEILHLARDTYSLDAPQSRSQVLTSLPKQDGHKEHAKAYFTYSSVPSRDTGGRIDGVVIYALDETEKHLREEAEEQKRMKAIFNNLSSVALALYDAQTGHLIMGSIRYLEWVASVHHLKSDELIGHHWQELTLIPSLDLASQFWQRALQGLRVTHTTELSYDIHSGEKLVWSNTFTPIFDTDEPGKVRFMLVSAFDITEQVQTSKDLGTSSHLKDG